MAESLAPKFQEIDLSLQWLNSPIQFLKGVGPYLAKLFEKLGVSTFEDLLYHLPFRYLDRRNLASIAKTEVGKQRVIYGQVDAVGEIRLGRRGRKVFEVIVTDGKGYLTAKWFHYPKKFFEQRFKKGERFLFFGEVSLYRGEKQMVHPEVTPLKEFFEEEDFQQHLGLVPVYSSTEGLYQRQIRKAVEGLLEELPTKLCESLPEELCEKWSLAPLVESFRRIHAPQEDDSIDAFGKQASPYHRRLIFEEFFYLQLGLAFRRRKAKLAEGYAHAPRMKRREEFLSRLPFSLTAGQERVIEEITRDMCQPKPMNRLLQGDVGSGKTLVSMVAALLAIENRRQVSIMAPTEILAEQHHRNFSRSFAGIAPVRLLTASTKGVARQEILDALSSGEPQVVIGTHALLEDPVAFDNLSLVVIDEQHRFGVRQRMQLMRKAIQPDVLVMTATPIPRSLAMTLYGDLDLSLMAEMPPGRQPILSRIMYEKDRPKLEDFLRQKLSDGQQAYVVFPLIEESEKLDLKNAKQGFEILKEKFNGYSVEMLHGRMKNAQKEEVMQRFSRGEVQILVATTVIEVGIDVPNATLMMIEHAERFGLSQLHQLRGRVGRGAKKSYCILAVDYRRSDLAKERLKVMEESSDGFRIAEEDLKIRGPGDFLGTRQSGMPDFRVGNLISDLNLLEAAREAARELLDLDPDLRSEAHQWMRPILEHRWKGRLSLAQVG